MAGRPNLAAFNIERVNFTDPGEAHTGHTEFMVDSAACTFGTDLAGHDAESIRAARAWAAGVLSRLLVTALPYIDAERHGHDCRWVDPDGTTQRACAVRGSRLAIDDNEDGPTLIVTVQTVNADAWLTRIGTWLRTIDNERPPIAATQESHASSKEHRP